MEVLEENFGEYTLSTDKSKIDLQTVHKFLSTESYWSRNIPIDIVKGSIENSLCFSVFHNKQQIAFARIISDFNTFAYLADVFVCQDHRGKGISKQMMDFIMRHPDLQNLRRFCLGTHDAHKLYEKFGFKIIGKPEFFMEIKVENPYS